MGQAIVVRGLASISTARQRWRYRPAHESWLVLVIQINMDFSVMRNFGIRERCNPQVRGETFNARNHTNFSAPGGTFGGSGFGTISSSGLGRQVQAGMRFTF